MEISSPSTASVALLNLHRALTFAHVRGLDPAMREALVGTALDAHAAGYDLGLFLFAFNCLLVGVLVYRSEFVPRWLGAGIGVAGLVYLVGSCLRFVAPGAAEAFAAAYAIPAVAELALCLWLLAKGLDQPRWRASSVANQT